MARSDPPVPYAELHAHSSFSFLDGASDPEELVAEAARLGLEALALTDHDGCYGVVRFAEAAAEAGLPTIFGAELGLAPDGRPRAEPRAGAIEPGTTHLVVLADGPEGYARLCGAISEGHLAGGEKGRPAFSLEALADAHGGHWKVLTGCRNGAVRRALEADGPAAAGRALGRLVEAFGKEAVLVELSDEGGALDGARNDALARLAVEAGLPIVATTNAHYATPAGYPLATALAAIRARRSLAEIEGYLPAWAGATLRSGAEQARRFRRYPGAVEEAAALGRALAFDLSLVAPGLPPFPTPEGEDEHAFLRRIAEEGGRARYGPRDAEAVPGAWAQIDRELEIIGALGFSGYFLVVWDLVEHCRRRGIYCQGRGSAANSAVCYAIGITNVDAVGLGLLFERFLSPAREGPPDIDLDIESGRREEVIAYVYARYGRTHAAQVANVITYRPRSALREAGRALGCSEGALQRYAKVLSALDGLPGEGEAAIPAPVVELARKLVGRPRHLGLHSGGMVICDRPVVEVCPVEWARREGRSALQWDKDDCAAAGLVKFDLLGLGMLEALHRMVDLVAGFHGVAVDLATIPQEDEVYAMLARGDSMGVFQVESRAQMATLPRLAPKVFYDLVVEVALIRPGPIQGGSVHPYLRRRNGEEPVTYLHPLLEPALKKTLGVPLFQEQLMRMAMDAAGLSAAEADQLRQAMGAKRSRAKMERLRARLEAGMAANGIPSGVAAAIFEQLAAFASFGFPESHSVSFAYLVYVSAWFKLHYPAAFLAGLLNAQPMGFWSPQSLVADARRHGVVVRRPDAQEGGAEAGLVADPASTGATAVRLGLQSVRGLREATARRIADGAPYADLEDLARRSGARRNELEALATAGALDGLVATRGGARRPPRRAALWAAGALGGTGGPTPTLPGIHVGLEAPTLPGMTALEEAAADLWATGVTVGTHPVAHLRPELDRAGIAAIGTLLGTGRDRERVRVAGLVTHRQRPATARGTVFVNLEDETGVLNVICSRGLWVRVRTATIAEAALVVTGRLEREQGVVNLVAEHMEGLAVPFEPGGARDFR